MVIPRRECVIYILITIVGITISDNIFNVLFVSDTSGFQSSMSGAPWVAVPFAETKARKGPIEAKVPCTGYPTPGVINAKTGAVIDADVFGKVNQAQYEAWMKQV